jgi:hypothetical protein
MRQSASQPFGDDTFGSGTPIVSTMQLPRLTALAANVGQVDTRLSLPPEVWWRLE